MEDKMEKKSNKVLEKETNIEKKGKLTSKQKEIIITIVVLIGSVLVGFFIGKYLFELMY